MSHTPTTRAIRRVYALAPPNLAQCNHTNPNEGYAAEQFDRWYQEELRKAQETAWDQGAEAVALLIPEYEWHDRGLRLPTNPYRSQP